ncbi:MAG: 5'/3'-nucleotidase SurE [Alphaproteobacteria bacterium]|nr:5'/3'-nucleotidase SurE [Alphaproteobacteria bacterium]
MRILVTNDDGIHAPGLETLETIARAISADVWVVAPAEEQSGAGHSLSLADPIRFRKIEERRYEVAGTPTDCVVMAARKIMPGLPDLVLSGVNRGQNIADDVTYSGTIAAAMEGTTLGLKSIALSQVTGIHGNGVSFAVAERHGAHIVRRLMSIEFGPGVLMNVNFPDCRPEDVQGIEVTRQGKRDQNLLTVDERVDARGRNYYWLGFQRERGDPAIGTDLWAVFNRRISVTPLHMNLTQIEAMETVRQALVTQ